MSLWNHLASATTAVVALVALAHPAAAQLEVSIGIGPQFGGDVYFDPPDEDVEIDSGVAAKISADYFPSKYFGIGLYASYFGSEHVDLSFGDIDVAEIGIGVKPRLPIEDLLGSVDLLITPGLLIGGRGMWDEEDSSSGLALDLGVDFRLRWENGFSVFVEPGFFTQPVGGNSERDITYGPIGYTLIGVGYAF